MAAAAAALAAAKQAASSTTAAQHGTVTLQETRRFAGKEVTVAREVATGSKEATKAAAEAESAAKKKAGLDAVLASLEHAKKARRRMSRGGGRTAGAVWATGAGQALRCAGGGRSAAPSVPAPCLPGR